MDLPNFAHLSAIQRAEWLADAACTALQEDRHADATALAAVSQSYASIAAYAHRAVDQETRAALQAETRTLKIRQLENPFTQEVAEYLAVRADRPVTNKEVKEALGMSDTHVGNALRDAAHRGFARKIGHRLWQAN
ncbi:hypothetical protein [Streptomyces yanii]|uniref:Uncharacterized protein n=1 Tax=Streptomyces yanii TaxID=78510 RepID=A0ABV5RJ03_9ACTN